MTEATAEQRGGGAMTLLELVIPESRWPAIPINVNAVRGHTRFTGRKSAEWRELGWLLARNRPPMETPVTISAHFRFKDNQVRDSSNLFLTLKALVDGIVDAGVLPGDDDRYVTHTGMSRERPNGPPRIVIRVESDPALSIPALERPRQRIRRASRPGDTDPPSHNPQIR